MVSITPAADRTMRLLAASAAAVSHTGDTDETTLATVAIAANAMGVDGILRVMTLWSNTNDASNKTLRVNLGSTTFGQVTLSTTGSFRYLQEIINRGSAASQVAHLQSAYSFGTGSTAVATGTEDTTGALNLTITGQLADGSDFIRLEAYRVELIRP